ncbi:MAG: hypothetical protein WA958_19500 [Tunicatimonas sp.]
MGRKRLNKRETPKVNPELEGFDIKIDTFGEIRTNYDVDKINQFLNRHVDDKKLRDRDDVRLDTSETEEDSDRDQK